MDNPLYYLEAYIHSSTKKREIMDEETARLVVLYCNRFFSDVNVATLNSVQLRLEIRAWLHNYKCDKTGNTLATSSKKTIAGLIGRFSKDCGLLTKEDLYELLSYFRPEESNWSEKTLSVTDEMRLINLLSVSSKQSFTKSRNLLSVMLMIITGMRVSQITLLKNDDVQVTDDTIVIFPTLQKRAGESKSRKEFSLDSAVGGYNFNSALTAYQYHSKIASYSNYYFHNRTGGQLSTAYFRGFFGKLGERLNISVSPHSCRHTAGTRISIECGITQAAIVLDHSDIRTTQRYVSKTQQDTAKIINKSLQKQENN